MTNLFDDLDEIRIRPGMWIGSKKISDMRKFIDGYRWACRCEQTRLKTKNGLHIDELHRFAAKKYGYSGNVGYANIILEQTDGNEEQELILFFELIDEFKTLTLSDMDYSAASFEEVLAEVHRWLDKIKEKSDKDFTPEQKLTIEIIRDDSECFRVMIENQRYMGELIVDNGPYQKPYKNVAFTIYDKEDTSEEPHYFYYYYDDESSHLQEIHSELMRGIIYMTSMVHGDICLLRWEN